ncbi:uncharacterized protein LOC110344774 [Heterocephalus glaber]|uniref:Uncharacterized protein LOC110344774 n=1 Tax=Heterocephalus glaber TaxID=10181 RepID=A0AAX6RFJ9_HETGA|nr:uncharacterized protein LOC110344774 [Heterocephalus glaber]
MGKEKAQLHFKKSRGQVWYCTPIISALGRLRQEDHHNLEGSLGLVRPCLTKPNTHTHTHTRARTCGRTRTHAPRVAEVCTLGLLPMNPTGRTAPGAQLGISARPPRPRHSPRGPNTAAGGVTVTLISERATKAQKPRDNPSHGTNRVRPDLVSTGFAQPHGPWWRTIVTGTSLITAPHCPAPTGFLFPCCSPCQGTGLPKAPGSLSVPVVIHHPLLCYQARSRYRARAPGETLSHSLVARCRFHGICCGLYPDPTPTSCPHRRGSGKGTGSRGRGSWVDDLLMSLQLKAKLGGEPWSKGIASVGVAWKGLSSSSPLDLPEFLFHFGFVCLFFETWFHCVYFRLALNSLCSPSWPLTVGDPPASASQVLG